ncbi:hypothetical protein ILYODFUR_016135 [Ilyodon furcidens]|uniref:Uncharacterized protein n=1 Tax=Ilyodon furcidens TaxID=33524 RepID=A0ABV0USF0_9TELE
MFVREHLRTNTTMKTKEHSRQVRDTFWENLKAELGCKIIFQATNISQSTEIHHPELPSCNLKCITAPTHLNKMSEFPHQHVIQHCRHQVKSHSFDLGVVEEKGCI